MGFQTNGTRILNVTLFNRHGYEMPMSFAINFFYHCEKNNRKKLAYDYIQYNILLFTIYYYLHHLNIFDFPSVCIYICKETVKKERVNRYLECLKVLGHLYMRVASIDTLKIKMVRRKSKEFKKIVFIS